MREYMILQQLRFPIVIIANARLDMIHSVLFRLKKEDKAYSEPVNHFRMTFGK